MALRLSHLLVGVSAFSAFAAACGGSKTGASTFDGGGDGSGGSGHHDGGHLGNADAKSDVVMLGGDDAGEIFDIEPSTLTTLTVKAGATSPTASFKATLNGSPTKAAWGVDRGDIGSITTGQVSTGVFTPNGTTGGLVTITASAGGQTFTRRVLVKLTATQSGPNASAA
jgi:hypothetical protein